MDPAEPPELAVFEAALQLSADRRSAYLDKTCARDADLRRRVDFLLGAFQRAGRFMKEPAVIRPRRSSVRSLPTEKPGDWIGRYKLLEQIGEGGCGVVYVAAQEEPVRRRVALKVIKLGMDTKQVIARFDAERQALAMMDHPNVARVLDAGASDRGRPYFVMELVRGIKITDYCEENQLYPRDRLDLFIQVCRAIQHAHQKGIIHRDIKPSNILVTLHDGVPVPKVIDFGIAKATQGRLTDQTIYTAFEQFMGTPAYMSPEQATMTSLDIDTRSDIYSLGVLLYELLTSKTPFDAKELLAAGLDEMRRTIREVEPIKPSTRLTQERLTTRLAGSGKSGIRIPKSEINQDLDSIVMKCLEKDRARRYETANGLATEVQRYLNDEPIIARPPSRLYRFKKSVQRNKLAFGAATAVALALVICSVVSTVMFFKERAALARAIAAEQIQARLRRQAEAGAIRAHGLQYVHNAEWNKAAGDFAKAAELDPDAQGVLFEAAIVSLKTGLTNEYDRLCHEYLERATDNRQFVSADMAAKASLLRPVAGADFARACELADFAATEDHSSSHARFVRLGKSLADYRRGQFESAIQWAERTIMGKGVTLRHEAAAYFIQTAALVRLGQYASARTAFQKGGELIDLQNDAFTGAVGETWYFTGSFGDTWFDLTIARLLRDEARTLLENQTNRATENKSLSH